METLESRSEEFIIRILRAITDGGSWASLGLDPETAKQIPPHANLSREDFLGGLQFRLSGLPGRVMTIEYDRGELCSMFVSIEAGSSAGTSVTTTRLAKSSIPFRSLRSEIKRVVEMLRLEQREEEP